MEGVDETENTYRFRQFDPGRCQEGTFRMMEFEGVKGVQATLCRPKDQASKSWTSTITDARGLIVVQPTLEGQRVCVKKEGDQHSVVTEMGKDITDSFPGLWKAMAQLNDVELECIWNESTSDPTLYVYDFVHHDKDARIDPYLLRLQQLNKALPAEGPGIKMVLIPTRVSIGKESLQKAIDWTCEQIPSETASLIHPVDSSHEIIIRLENNDDTNVTLEPDDSSRGCNTDSVSSTEAQKSEEAADEETDTQVAFLAKGSDEEKVAYGIVLQPDTIDYQGDIVRADEIQRVAWHYLEHRHIGKEHVGSPREDCFVVESYIAPMDFCFDGQDEGTQVLKGSWVLAVRVPDELWKKVKLGELTGFSIQGEGRRRPIRVA